MENERKDHDSPSRSTLTCLGHPHSDSRRPTERINLRLDRRQSLGPRFVVELELVVDPKGDDRFEVQESPERGDGVERRLCNSQQTPETSNCCEGDMTSLDEVGSRFFFLAESTGLACIDEMRFEDFSHSLYEY